MSVQVSESPPRAPKGRRLSSGRRLSGFNPNELGLDENDDESERNRAAQLRAEQAEQLLKKARSPIRGTPGHQRRLQMYQEAIAMTTENVRLPESTSAD